MNSATVGPRLLIRQARLLILQLMSISRHRSRILGMQGMAVQMCTHILSKLTALGIVIFMSGTRAICGNNSDAQVVIL